MDIEKDPRYLKAIELIREVVAVDPKQRGFYLVAFQMKPLPGTEKIECGTLTACLCTDQMVDAMVCEIFANPEFAAVREQALADENESRRADNILGGPPKGSA